MFPYESGPPLRLSMMSNLSPETAKLMRRATRAFEDSWLIRRESDMLVRYSQTLRRSISESKTRKP
jgi:hypothetical protein